VLAVALALRLLAAGAVEWFVRRSGTGRLCVFPDTEYYWLLARAIRTGGAYEVVEWGHIRLRAVRTPGYPLFLAACQACFGESPLAARLVQAALGTASVWLVYCLTRQVGPCRAPEAGALPPRWTAPLLAAALVAVNPYDVAISEVLLSEALFIPLLLLLLWGLATLTRPYDEPEFSVAQSSLVALATGVAGGAAVLTRPSFALFPPAVLLGWLIACTAGSDRRWRTASWRGSVLVLVGFVLVMGPWWIRNAQIYGRFVPTSLWLGASLYDGLNPQATGASNMSFRDEPEFRMLEELDQDAALTRRALDFARSDPLRVLELAKIKLGRYWSPWLNAERYRSRALAVASAVVVIPMYLLLVAGAWKRRRDPRALVLLAGPLLYFCAFHLVFVSSVRYRIAGDVAATGLAAIGLESIIRRVRAATQRA
jgi:4-amino-4-deoxy-L-arabinose transferase-like glycosyltransferase